MQARAIRIHSQGAADVLQIETVDVPQPGPGQALVRHRAIGVNFLDVYHRSGVYKLPLPSGCGSEGAGLVEAVGQNVTLFRPGDRVAYAGGEPGSYAELRLMPADRLVAVPDGISDEIAAASMMKGMTTEYLLNRCARVKAGDYALMYAAAGGVGLFAGQWAQHMGVKLIGVAAGPDKCALAAANGYATVIDRTSEDVAARVREITGGRGVPAVFDSVGKATFDTSIECLAPRGMFVSFGATTGAPPPVAAGLLVSKGSLFFTRPSVAHYTATREELVASATAVFNLLEQGVLRPQIGHRYALADAATAHRDLEAGRTTGSTLLTL